MALSHYIGKQSLGILAAYRQQQIAYDFQEKVIWISFVAILVLLLPFQSSFALEEDCSTLISSGSNEYPPFMWFSSEARQPQGALVDFINWHNQHSAVKIDNRYTGAWARTQRQARKIDLLIGLFYNEERDSSLDFIYPPVAQSHSRIWLNSKKLLDIQALSDLVGHQGATVNGFSLGKEFDLYAQEHLNLFRTKSIRQGFKMLSSQRIDYVVYEEQPGLSILSTMPEISNLQLAPYLIATEDIFIAITKDSPCNTEEVKAELEASLKKAAALNIMPSFIEQAKELWKKVPELSAN